MKVVTWEENGKQHKTLVRDTDTEMVALEGGGVSQDPPDVERLDWNQIKLDLHNQLLHRGIITQDDVVHNQNGLTAAVLAALRPKLKQLYKEG